MRKLGKILRYIVSGLLLLYICLILLLHLPFVQREIGRQVANALSEKFNTKVEVGKVNLGFLNRVIIDNIKMEDKAGEEMFSISRTAVQLDLLSIFVGEINITTAQVFGLKANLHKETPESELNCRFVIDALKSKEEGKKSKINIQVRSFIMRHANINYDVRSLPRTDSIFNTNHLSLQNLAVTATLKYQPDEFVTIDLKRLDFTERNSGFRLEKLRTEAEYNYTSNSILLNDLCISTGNSHLQISKLNVLLNSKTGTSMVKAANCSLSDTEIYLPDFKAFSNNLSRFSTPLRLSALIKYKNDELQCNNLIVVSPDDNLTIRASCSIDHLSNEQPDIRIDIENLYIVSELIKSALENYFEENNVTNAIINLGTVRANGSMVRNRNVSSVEFELSSDAGDIDASAILYNDHSLQAHVNSEEFNLGQVLQNPDLGEISLNIDADGTLLNNQMKSTKLKGSITQLEYANYVYDNIVIDGIVDGSGFDGLLSVEDENLDFAMNGVIEKLNNGFYSANVDMNLLRFNPYALNLTKDHADSYYRLKAHTDISGSTLNNVIGFINIDSLLITTSTEQISLQKFDVDVLENTPDNRQINVRSDFLNASLAGKFNIEELFPCYMRSLSAHLPSLNLKPNQGSAIHSNNAEFELELSDSPLLHHFIKTDYELTGKVRVNGSVNTESDLYDLTLDIPTFSYENYNLSDIHASYKSAANQAESTIHTKFISETGATDLDIISIAEDDHVNNTVKWDKPTYKTSYGELISVVSFSEILNKTKTQIEIQPSIVSFNDTLWQTSHALVDIYDNTYKVNNLKIYRGNQYLNISGTISHSPGDSLVAELSSVPVEYLQNMSKFKSVTFQGMATGRAVVSNVYTLPDIHADLVVDDFCLQNGLLGKANIHAQWDNAINGIEMQADIHDTDEEGKPRLTTLDGYIVPSTKEMDLCVNTNNTNAEFLNGFIGRTFRDIKGNINGTIHIIGPLNDVNIVGSASADVEMTMKATSATYHISPEDSLYFTPYDFVFDNIRLYDKNHNEGVVNGHLRHKNMKNFVYNFTIDMNQLLVYEEQRFNNDKFCGRIYANGKCEINGSDGHPLHISGDITTTRNSYFAYDNSTPDAITSGSFITFNSVSDKTDSLQTSKSGQSVAENTYRGDIYLDANIHLTPDCEIRLKMDSHDDGYISTFGSGTLVAHYHNKSPFTLHGNYAISGGRYRLYLQDIIYRDLHIQPNSVVQFNGNPFDANIHLICWHTLNAVPLSDLTASASYLQNNKAKVVCILDITGQLGNMLLAFDLDLPNVSDETRSLVRSLISTEEEMNTQIIYLLGLGRFYTNEAARQMGDTSSSGTVNNLLSSTISGQINQMLTNMIGTESKWNFGTGLSTGERGWNDLDVEGILSGRLLDDRLLINGNFGYRDNVLTQQGSFIGDFDIKWRIKRNHNLYLKAYNQNNDRYFTKGTLNTQGIGISYQKDFESWKTLFFKKRKKE